MSFDRSPDWDQLMYRCLFILLMSAGFACTEYSLQDADEEQLLQKRLSEISGTWSGCSETTKIRHIYNFIYQKSGNGGIGTVEFIKHEDSACLTTSTDADAKTLTMYQFSYEIGPFDSQGGTLQVRPKRADDEGYGSPMAVAYRLEGLDQRTMKIPDLQSMFGAAFLNADEGDPKAPYELDGDQDWVTTNLVHGVRDNSYIRSILGGYYARSLANKSYALCDTKDHGQKLNFLGFDPLTNLLPGFYIHGSFTDDACANEILDFEQEPFEARVLGPSQPSKPHLIDIDFLIGKSSESRRTYQLTLNIENPKALALADFSAIDSQSPTRLPANADMIYRLHTTQNLLVGFWRGPCISDQASQSAYRIILLIRNTGTTIKRVNYALVEDPTKRCREGSLSEEILEGPELTVRGDLAWFNYLKPESIKYTLNPLGSDALIKGFYQCGARINANCANQLNVFLQGLVIRVSRNTELGTTVFQVNDSTYDRDPDQS